MTERRRVRITNPLTAARTHTPRSVRQEIDESTGVGEVYVRTLVRSQLRAAITVVAVLTCTVGMLPLVFLLAPTLTTISVAGVPLPWLVLGVGVFPVLWLLGWLYVRRAERTETAFAALVDTSGGDL